MDRIVLKSGRALWLSQIVSDQRLEGPDGQVYVQLAMASCTTAAIPRQASLLTPGAQQEVEIHVLPLTIQLNAQESAEYLEIVEELTLRLGDTALEGAAAALQAAHAGAPSELGG